MTWKQFFEYYFKFSFTGQELFLYTPWFALWISDGAKKLYNATIWWGFLISWGRNKTCKEGDLLYIHTKEVIFREISLMQIYQNNWQDAYRQGLL